TEICNISLHDALPISADRRCRSLSAGLRVSDRIYFALRWAWRGRGGLPGWNTTRVSKVEAAEQHHEFRCVDFEPIGTRRDLRQPDRKSTRLNSSHVKI